MQWCAHNAALCCVQVKSQQPAAEELKTTHLDGVVKLAADELALIHAALSISQAGLQALQLSLQQQEQQRQRQLRSAHWCSVATRSALLNKLLSRWAVVKCMMCCTSNTAHVFYAWLGADNMLMSSGSFSGHLLASDTHLQLFDL
jgi:hypothetical protein